jgi:Sec-independent protein secretion pathway component TatC
MWVNQSTMQLRIAIAEPGGGVSIRGSELTSGSGVVPQYRVSEYVKMFFGLAMAFAVGFQTPIIVLLLGWGGIVTPQTLGKYRRHAILVICVVCAVLTPPDPFSMVLLAAPLYVLFELGAVLLRLMPLGASRREPDNDPDDEAPNNPQGGTNP